MILLKRNSRLFQYHQVFGSTTTFLPTVSLDAGFLDIEPVGSVACVLYSADKVKSGETGKRYDHIWLETEARKTGKMGVQGMSPQDGFSVAVKGQKVVPTGEIETSAGYFQVDLGPGDFFTNVKSAIQMEYNKGEKRPVAVGTHWYPEWTNQTVLTAIQETAGFFGSIFQKIPLFGRLFGSTYSDHEWVICGWDDTHPDMFKIDAHIGYYMYMPRDVFNKAMDATYGSVALTLAETTQEIIEFNKAVKISIITKMLDFLYNMYAVLFPPAPPFKSDYTTPPQPPVAPTPAVQPVVTPKYLWDTAENARHSVRVICDEEGLTVEQKNTMCATVGAESGWQSYYLSGPKKGQPVKRENLVGGAMWSTDWGICQWNDHYHAKEITPQESLDNPEKAVRLMCKYWKQGLRTTWVAYSDGSYKKYL